MSEETGKLVFDKTILANLEQRLKEIDEQLPNASPRMRAKLGNDGLAMALDSLKYLLRVCEPRDA
ncbi:MULTISPECIES: hypothetical protein [unclassified Mesorhizobium]|uniref:hypothetical protein n=1 Tax=unclassified Mesorhizobium TaxID=325217 RepID=UPI000FCB975C|nr:MULTISPECIES: hypothetical protein [unclassified Mesorhizobium]RUU47089.1 hypothetical protein EOC93_01275 [Mesorhizobium sp. M6A.T.Ce.TU.002.03.1.1]RUV04543.1 hypothetical protein EOB36_02075 [Mesorhizobium sp. M6A.T.Cr.TU.017.01.1.1]RVB78583.1 hypothetical protein EN885_08340 [Mesorhizobium sp. M6A.T.Cr.TU.014.01.1.1]RWP81225.1 MAG: hypothetical protein EOR10_07370 [Mesorhizobium sp.]RWP95559.1 MAG: hypothetical protein EOR91_32340 [Mesorhizobium sp.]